MIALTFCSSRESFLDNLSVECVCMGIIMYDRKSRVPTVLDKSRKIAQHGVKRNANVVEEK
jgi:hypothetical protein